MVGGPKVISHVSCANGSTTMLPEKLLGKQWTIFTSSVFLGLSLNLFLFRNQLLFY